MKKYTLKETRKLLKGNLWFNDVESIQSIGKSLKTIFDHVNALYEPIESDHQGESVTDN